MKVQQIDKDKLRAEIRKRPQEYIYQMLDDAIDFLAPTKLRKLVKPYVRADRLQPDTGSTASLLDAARKFSQASLNREYFEAFDVNWKNCTQISKGTGAWITDCKRLLGNCVTAASEKRHEEAREAFEILFDLLR